MSSANRRLLSNSPSIFMPFVSQLKLLNMLSSVAVTMFSEMVSPCVFPFMVLIFSLSLCRCTVTELTVYVIYDFYVGPTHLLFLVLVMVSILLGFVLTQMPDAIY